MHCGPASLHELNYFEGDIFFLMLWDPMGGWVFSMTWDNCSWNECLNLRC